VSALCSEDTKDGPHRGAFAVWRRGGIQLARYARSLPTGRCAAASVEQGSKSSTTLGEKRKKPHKGAYCASGGEGVCLFIIQ
jgi:hypothetical protein